MAGMVIGKLKHKFEMETTTLHIAHLPMISKAKKLAGVLNRFTASLIKNNQASV